MYDKSNQLYWIIKSRLCGRGYLDRQKNDVMRHSSTASRLSQRLLCSLCVQYELELETWDISNAFLKGLNYAELERLSKRLGLELRVNRKLYLKPPANVWRHLRDHPHSNIKIPEYLIGEFFLLLLKAIYGTVDAPLLFQLGLSLFVIERLFGVPSCLDENFFYWVDNGRVLMVCTIHVDDILLAYTRWIRDWCYDEMTRQYGELKVHQTPFTHMGMTYEWLVPRVLRVHQDNYVRGLRLCNISSQRLKDIDDPCSPSETTEFRSALCSLLWVVQTLEHIYCEVVLLQQKQVKHTITDVRQLNRLIQHVKKDCSEGTFGLMFAPLKMPLRSAAVGDCSHATTKTSYPQEGTAVLLTEDRLDRVKVHNEVVTMNAEYHGGRCHRLFVGSRRAKRISQSTSHGETNAGLNVSQHAQLIALRISEIFTNNTNKRYNLKDLMLIEDNASYVLPIDLYTDCLDFWELCCGVRGIPTDKTQRLSILGMREDRLAGRLRYMIHINTENMIMDGLTKLGTFKQLMHLMTTGIVKITPCSDKPILMRRSPRLTDFTENDLVQMPGNESATTITKGENDNTSKEKKHVRFTIPFNEFHQHYFEVID